MCTSEIDQGISAFNCTALNYIVKLWTCILPVMKFILTIGVFSFYDVKDWVFKDMYVIENGVLE